MGANCVKSTSRERALSGEFQMVKNISVGGIKQEYSFEITINNVCLNTRANSLCSIVFQLGSKVRIQFPINETSSQENLILWPDIHTHFITMTSKEMEKNKLNIRVLSLEPKKEQVLSLKFNQLCRGPIHHDHLLPEIRSRVIFDIAINEVVDIKIICKNFKIYDCSGKQRNQNYFNCSVCLMSDSELQQSEEPQMNSLKEEIQMHTNLLSKSLKQSSLRLTIWQKTAEQQIVLSQFYIPYQKFVSQANGYFTQKINDIDYIKRKVVWHQALKQEREIYLKAPQYQQGRKSQKQQGSIQFDLIWSQSQAFVEQLQGVICSEKGIGTVSPHFLINQGNHSLFSHSDTHLDYDQLLNLKRQFKKLKLTKKHGSKQKQLLLKTYQCLTKKRKSLEDINLLDIDFSNYDEQKTTYEFQILLLDLLEDICSLIEEGQDFINETVWKIFGTIIRRQELSIRYLHSIDKIKDKKDLGVKFYRFLCSTLCMVVRSTALGLTFNELKYSQKFIAYCYFRYPILEKRFLDGICKSSDPIFSPERLAEMGACVGVKSPSKTMVFDWEANFFSFIKNQLEYLQQQQKLKQTMQSLPDWIKMLFNQQDDQVYYGGLSQIISQAQVTLNYQDKIMWEYFPNYGKILGRFQALLRDTQPVGFNPHFRAFAVKLMLNEKLFKNFIKYLFSKTFLYNTYTVMRSLDIIRSCFQVMVSTNSKLPSDFNYNFFYKGIVSILELNHSYLVIKTFNILYAYYHMLSKQCQANIDFFILGPHFYHLFLHWYYNARRMFMCFLIKRILPKFQLQENQTNQRKHSKDQIKSRSHSEEIIISNLNKINIYMIKLEQKSKEISKISNHHPPGLIKNQYYLRMKQKIKQKRQNHQRNKKMINSAVFLKGKSNKRQSFEEQKDSKDVLSVFSNRDSEEGSKIRKRRWSTSIENQNSSQVPKQLEHYVIAALEQYQSIKQTPKLLDKQVENIMAAFQSKKKIDEKQ